MYPIVSVLESGNRVRTRGYPRVTRNAGRVAGLCILKFAVSGSGRMSYILNFAGSGSGIGPQ